MIWRLYLLAVCLAGGCFFQGANRIVYGDAKHGQQQAHGDENQPWADGEIVLLVISVVTVAFFVAFFVGGVIRLFGPSWRCIFDGSRGNLVGSIMMSGRRGRALLEAVAVRDLLRLERVRGTATGDGFAVAVVERSSRVGVVQLLLAGRLELLVLRAHDGEIKTEKEKRRTGKEKTRTYQDQTDKSRRRLKELRKLRKLRLQLPSPTRREEATGRVLPVPAAVTKPERPASDPSIKTKTNQAPIDSNCWYMWLPCSGLLTWRGTTQT